MVKTVLAAIAAISTTSAAIAVLVGGELSPYQVVMVHSHTMTDAVAWRTAADVGLAAMFAQFSLLSFLFLWGQYRRWRAIALRSNPHTTQRPG